MHVILSRMFLEVQPNSSSVAEATHYEDFSELQGCTITGSD